jgi:hypothetical protein
VGVYIQFQEESCFVLSIKRVGVQPRIEQHGAPGSRRFHGKRQG